MPKKAVMAVEMPQNAINGNPGVLIPADRPELCQPVPVVRDGAAPGSGAGLEYEAFLATKSLRHMATGVTVADGDIHESLFPFQRDLTKWALAKGRSAIFAGTGLGKTRMSLEWARLTGKRTLILAPLAVATQTVKEAATIGMEVIYARKQADAGDVTITNYEMLPHFNPKEFGAVVLDESSLLKALDGKTRKRLTEAFASTPLRLCCTATPAPNDIAEIANHAEFLGIMTRVEMLATFFVHDDEGWRLKGHAREAFYKWMASWGISLRRPSDLGYSDAGYDLPPLTVTPHFIETDACPEGQLFAFGLKGITDRSRMRKATLNDRVAHSLSLVDQDRDEPWMLWCGLNDEQDAVAKALGDKCFSVYGSLDVDEKVSRIQAWVDGERPYMVSKVGICGHGLNFQHCARTAYVGLNDSWEGYYQSLRRFWRFGQLRAVHAHVVLSEAEQAIFSNVMRKEAEAEKMAAELIKHVAEFELSEIRTSQGKVDYLPAMPMRVPGWLKGEVG